MRGSDLHWGEGQKGFLEEKSWKLSWKDSPKTAGPGASGAS